MPGAKPVPDTRSPLLKILKDRIRRDGPISIADYMALCLGDPELGYYMTRDPLGAKGDFTTAPEISQVFGELIGLWCAVTWQHMGAPSPVRLVELGPGRGTLIADALRATGVVSGFNEAARVHLVETSPVLRGIQKETLSSHAKRVEWHESLADVPAGATIIIANEFLDALPVRQFMLRGEDWFERCVGIADDGALEFRLSPAPLNDTSRIPDSIRKTARDGDIAEVCQAMGDIMRTIAARSETAPAAALFIDYGHIESAPGDTLQAVRAHGYMSPLAAPGHDDLTAHVDFARLTGLAQSAGLKAHGPMTQGAFLMALGLQERTQRLAANASEETAHSILSGAKRLAEPGQMGELFKVLAVTAPGLQPPPFEANG